MNKDNSGEIKDSKEVAVTKKCPFCAEEIKFEAIYCKFCKRDLIDKPVEKEKVIIKTVEKKEGLFLQSMNAGCGCFLLIILFFIACFIWAGIQK